MSTMRATEPQETTIEAWVVDGRAFRAPGPGSWESDPVHFARPMTRFVASIIGEPFARGLRRNAAMYGLTLDTFQPAPQHGVFYMRKVPFGVPDDAQGAPTQEQFAGLVASPAYAERLARGSAAFARKAWREELSRWDREVKPRATMQHLALQAEEPARLSDEELADHLLRARDQLMAMWEQHHDFTVSAILPVGDYLAHAQEWTGLSHGELLRPLRGSSPVSRGAAASELDDLAAIVRASPAARRVLRDSPGDALRLLSEAPEPIGSATRAWLGVAGHRSLGYDVSDPFALEMPAVLVQGLLAALESPVGQDKGVSAAERAEKQVRDLVPVAHRAAFDELLAEARGINRLRDERGNYSDGWAAGLCRRALLEAGARLATRGVFPDAELAIDATAEELVALLLRSGGPSAAELERHRRFRLGHVLDDFPAWLGDEPAPPPPVEWLPEGSRRIVRAIEAGIAALFNEPEGGHARDDAATLTGLAVSPGLYEGVARIVRDGEDFAKLRRGDVLVTRATAATFNVVMPLLGAIVTDRGGQLCHAAIVARENGLPAVVGTKLATSVIRDGARVRVDGSSGRVTVLS